MPPKISKRDHAWRHNGLQGRLARARNFLNGLDEEESLTPVAKQLAHELLIKLDQLKIAAKERNDARFE